MQTPKGKALHTSSFFQTWGSACLVILSLLLSIIIYSFGWSGSWQFDDEPNLGALATVFENGHISSAVALDFIFSGQAGPLGRSLALASFIMDGSGWPHDPHAMLYTNSLLHALNGTLLTAVLLLLGRLRGWNTKQAAWIAAISSSLWLLLPLLASSSLMAVQRMTVLSSTFMLVGLWLYLLGRQHLIKAPWAGLSIMTAGLGLGTLLGIFTKEQAALLPLLVLVLEVIWLPAVSIQTPRAQKTWLCFRYLALYLPTLLIVLYLLRIVLNAESNYALRDFSLSERLWTQAVIMWDYLRLAFLPRAALLGPFHDDYPILNAGWVTSIAALSWVIAGVLAWYLRKKTVLPFLALTWFWVAHLLESTVIPLELYFEHRNYIALTIPIFALVASAWLWAIENKGLRLIAFTFSVYALFLAVMLHQTTSLFGQPRIAAEIWYTKHEKSGRSAQYLAQQLFLVGERKAALSIIDHTASLALHSGDLQLQGLQLACGRETNKQLHARYDLALENLPLAGNRYSIITSLDRLKTLHDQKQCDFLTLNRLAELTQKALENPHFTSNAQNLANLHVFAATFYIDERNLDKTMYHLLRALDAVTDIETLRLAIAVLNSAGLSQPAQDLLDKYQPTLPKNPWLKQKILAQLEELRTNSHTLRIPELKNLKLQDQ